MLDVKPADRRRFPATAPDTMPLMIGDDGCAADAGIVGPRPDAPVLAEALLPTAQTPIKMAALTKLILFLWFILCQTIQRQWWWSVMVWHGRFDGWRHVMMVDSLDLTDVGESPTERGQSSDRQTKGL